MTARYLSRSDYEYRIQQQHRTRAAARQAILSTPRYWTEATVPYGYHNAYCTNPQGVDLPQPWARAAQPGLYTCTIHQDRLAELEAITRQALQIGGNHDRK